MDRKYELLKDDYIEHFGRTLYRIKALKDFGDVKAGDLGGYVENENNLNHEGECWIYANAKVYDDARVYENAQIRDYAQIYGEAWIYDNSEVYGNAKVFGYASICEDAKVYENAIVYGNAEVYGDAKVLDNARVLDNAKVFNNAKIFDNAKVYGSAIIYENSRVYGNVQVYDNARVFGNAIINKGVVIGKISMPYKDIFQHQCENRVLTAILTENDEILYLIGCQENITEEEFIYRIHNKDGGLEKNPHRAEYLRLIPLINTYFKGE